MNPTATLVPLAAFTMVAFIVWFQTREKQTRIQARTELHKHLIDKFASGTELAQFLETEGGKNVIEDLGRGERHVRTRALAPMIAGSVLTCLGAAFLLLAFWQPGLVIAGGVIFAIGVGFLIGAVVTLRLTRSWEAEKERGVLDGSRSSGSTGVGSSSIT